MGIFSRLTQLIRANVNDLLDRAEDPEKMIDQILRDMKSSIVEARSAVVAMIAQEKIIAGDAELAQRYANEWGRKALAAVNTGKDDLAREALRRKRDNEANAKLYAEQHQVQLQGVAKLKEQLRQLEAKYQETLVKRDGLIARHRRAKAQEKVVGMLSAYVPYDPSAELDRMDRKIREREAYAGSLAETVDESWDSQFRALSDPAIEAELKALKRDGVLALVDLRPSRDLEDPDVERELQALKEDAEGSPQE